MLLSKDDFVKLQRNDPSLTTVHFNLHEDPSLFPTVMQYLESNTNVTSLHLVDQTDDAVAVSNVLRKNRSITNLVLNGGVSNKGCATLRQALNNNTTLRELGLCNVKVNSDGLKELFNGCTANSSLTSFICSELHIGEQEYKTFGEILATNSSLKSLNIICNEERGGGGVRLLIEGLKTNTSLTELILRRNNVGDKEISTLGTILSSNQSLKYLNLSLNSLTDEGIQQLALSLTSCSLERLDIEYNNSITSRSLPHLMKIYQQAPNVIIRVGLREDKLKWLKTERKV
jgi:Ran GTPase-activating protein (RanGAP) involved in mRNA processing and transport